MNYDLEWSSRTPPLSPWWHPVADAMEPVVELAVIALGVIAMPGPMVLPLAAGP